MFSSNKFEDILKRFKNKTMPHAYIFSTNNIDKLKSDLDILIKNILCVEEFCFECKKECNICHLFDSNSLPNYIDVYPDGMQIKKDQIDFIKEKFEKKPLYGEYNIYVINNCDFLNDKSSNILLKFLEEPEDNILGFFVTDNLEKVLPTIKSRCEVVTVLYEEKEEFNQEYIDSICDFINYIKGDSNIYLIYDSLFKNLDYTRKDFYSILQTMVSLFEKNIFSHEIVFLNDFNLEKTIKSMELLKNTLSKIESNVNIEVAIILFAEELRKIYE